MARQLRPNRTEARADRKAKRNKKDHAPLLGLVAELEARRQGPQPRTPARREKLTPLTANQKRYDALIRGCDLIFGLGVAGTGKTWYAVQMAVDAFLAGEIDKIICTRPMVEAGEGVGFLPGTLEEKFAPYFQPVRDALDEGFGAAHAEYLINQGRILVKPLEFIRGSTLKDCWVIADEMQNATVTQTKMLLSRIGEPAKMILNGDQNQIDLPRPSMSGLLDAAERMTGFDRVGRVDFGESDIVRSGMCRNVILAYSRPNPIRNPANDRSRSDEHDDDTGLRKTLRL